MIDQYYRMVVYQCIIVLFLLAGCVQVSSVNPGNTRSAPIVEKSQTVIKKPQAQIFGVSTVTPKPLQHVKQDIKSLAILLSEGNRRYQHIANALTNQLNKPVKLFYLNNVLDQQEQVIEHLQDSSYLVVVVIGSMAANHAKRLSGKRVVFANVFNYQADGLLEAGFSGVSMIPSTEVLMAQWKKTFPSLSRVAIFTGSHNDQQVAQIAERAKKWEVSIEHCVVNNDKEMLYTAKQVVDGVQGVWLLPDNRILSRRAMKELMSYTLKHNKQVVVFNRELLKLGGLFYVSADPKYVAAQIIKAVMGPPSTLLELDNALIEVNKMRVEQLNLS